MKKILLPFVAFSALALTGCSFLANPKTTTQNESSNNKSTTTSTIVDNSREIYSSAYKKVSDVITPKSTNSNKLNYMNSLVIDDNTPVESDLHNLDATRAIIYFTHLLYENEKYPITDSIVNFTCNGMSGDVIYQYNNMNSLSTMDKDNNKISLQLYGSSSETEDGGQLLYLYLDIDYDFSNNTINSFDLIVSQYQNNNAYPLFAERYENGTLYDFSGYNSTTLKEMTDAVYGEALTDFMANLDDTIDAGDFTAEYNEATEYVFGADFWKNF